MNVDDTIEDIARDATAEADRVAADEAGKAVQEETTKGSAEGAGKEIGDHTDGIPAIGAPGATPVAEPPVVGEAVVKDQPSTSDAPHQADTLRLATTCSSAYQGRQALGCQPKDKFLMKTSPPPLDLRSSTSHAPAAVGLGKNSSSKP